MQPVTLTPEMRRLLVTLGDAPPIPITPNRMTDARAAFDAANRRWARDLPAVRSVGDIFLDRGAGKEHLRVQLIVPADAQSGAIVFVHGGGFVFGSPESHERFARLLAVGSRRTVLSVDYALAPEHPWPCGVQDVQTVLAEQTRILTENGLEPGRCFLVGDSAGATIALSALLSCSAKPDGAVLFYGAFGTDFDTPSYLSQAHGPRLTRARMMDYWRLYAPDTADWSRSDVVPLAATDTALSALPPLRLVAAEADPLRSDSERLAARLRGIGRHDTLEVIPGVIHGFLQMTAELCVASQVTAEAAAWLGQP